MNTQKPDFLYICQTDKDQIQIKTRLEIDNEITWTEESGQDINFKVIGKIPLPGLTIDFPPSRITWYEEKEKEKAFVDKVVMTIINYIF